MTSGGIGCLRWVEGVEGQRGRFEIWGGGEIHC
jgi:hypothetical protein